MAGRIMRASRRSYLRWSGIACGMAVTRGFSTSTPTPSHKVTYSNFKLTCSNLLKDSEMVTVSFSNKEDIDKGPVLTL